MIIFSAFSPEELVEQILKIQKVKDKRVVNVSLEFNVEVNMDMIIFHIENGAIYENSLLSFGKENALALDIDAPIAVDLVELGDRGERYIFIEHLRAGFASKQVVLAKKTLV